MKNKWEEGGVMAKMDAMFLDVDALAPKNGTDATGAFLIPAAQRTEYVMALQREHREAGMREDELPALGGPVTLYGVPVVAIGGTDWFYVDVRGRMQAIPNPPKLTAQTCGECGRELE